MQKISLFIYSFIDTIFESRDQTGYNYFWPCLPNNFFYKRPIFENLYQHARNQFIPNVYSSDTVNFRVQRPDLA